MLALLATAACAELDAATCMPCDDECPRDLECDAELRVCVPRDDPDACPAASNQSTGGGTTEGALSGGPGSGGSAGNSGGSAGNSGGSAGNSGGSAGNSGNGGDEPGSGGSAGDGNLDGTTGSGSGVGGTTGSSGMGGTSDGDGTSSGTTGGVDPCSSGCEPEILTERQLPGMCQDREAHVEFKARCACDSENAARHLAWFGANLSGLTLDRESGVLTGSLAPGRHEFEVRVMIDERVESRDTFTLTVWEHCRAFLISDDANAHDQVLATRLDSGEADPLPRVLGDDADVAAFDLSPDGNFLAQVEVLDDVEQLSLVRVTNDEIEAVDLEHDGLHEQHAFSRDSHWLAILTSNPEDSNPEDPATSLLQLVDLTTNPVELVDAKPIEHTAGLAWSDIGGVLYSAPDPWDTTWDFVHEQLVEDDAWGNDIGYPETAMFDDPVLAFLVSDAGFFTVRQKVTTYRDRSEVGVRQLPYPDLVSPGLGWLSYYLDDGSRVDPVNQDPLPDAPYAVALGCDFVSAWSGDDSTFVCVDAWAPVVYQTGVEGYLEGTSVPLPDELRGPTARMALSQHGNWFAFVPNDEGLLVLSAEQYADAEVDAPTLESVLEGMNEWDFFFTKDEQKLVVQRGRELLVGTLEPEGPAFTSVELEPSLNAVPECLPSWEPDPDHWCGAPHFAGNILISDQETHLLVIDSESRARAVELATLTPLTLGTVSESCTGDCVQFQ